VARLVERVDHLAVHVELELLVRGVPHAHGLRRGVAGEPRQLELGEHALAGQAVHDLELRRGAGGGAEEPVAPRGGLLVVAAVHEGEQREGGVAQPAVAVVPVARAAQVLGERGGGRGDDAAGGREGQRLEGDERPPHRLGVRALVRAARGPRLPEARGAVDGRAGVGGERHRLVRRGVGEDEVGGLALAHGEVGHRGEPLAVQRRLGGAGGAQHHHARAGDGAQRVVVEAGDPRDRGAVVEAQHELGAHRHAPAPADHPAHDVGRAVGRRHRVDHGHRAAGGLPLGLEHEGVGAVAARRPRVGVGGGEEPAAVVGVPNRAAMHAGASKRGQHSQSIDPAAETRAAVSQSPRRA
jgi:hypothetical protein